MVVLAGCAGTGGDGTASPTPSESETPDNGANIEPVDATSEEVIVQAVEAMDGVDSYQLSGTLNQTVRSENGERNLRAEVNTSVDRATQRLRSSQTIDAGIQTITTTTYIVNGSVYQRSSQFVNQYDSEWIQIETAGGIQDQFNRNDELTAHRVMLENASVDLVGAQEIDGDQAYRLELDVDEDALSNFYGFGNASVTLQEVNATVWIDTDSNRLVRSEGTIRQQITVQGQQVTSVIRYDERFAYTGATITLPDAASSAVEVNGTTGLAS